NAAYAAAALVPEDEREADGVTIRQRRWLSNGDAGRRINKAIELCCYDHADGEPDTYTFRESVRLLELEDFQRMYAHAGLALVETFGDYDGGPHTPESPRLILHARRADG
ncbi:MAG: hypothetical protein R3362_03265, partial [Rhodothermales bacterium]|nr:hypothetical protein [Rhodothermales bacterium]